MERRDSSLALKRPEFNLHIGGAYLKELSLRYKGFQPAVFGAYNAGEFAMDAWLARRSDPDPLIWIEKVPFGEIKIERLESRLKVNGN